MTISVGDKLPDVKLVKATDEGPDAVQSSEYFSGKRIALFSVPGAFTPTCSAKHLPGFVDKAADLKAKGIDEIACTAVNDAFVLKAWNEDAGHPDVTMLADGNAELVNALGLTMDGSGFGMERADSVSRWSSMTAWSNSSMSKRRAISTSQAQSTCLRSFDRLRCCFARGFAGTGGPLFCAHDQPCLLRGGN